MKYQLFFLNIDHLIIVIAGLIPKYFFKKNIGYSVIFDKITTKGKPTSNASHILKRIKLGTQQGLQSKSTLICLICFEGI